MTVCILGAPNAGKSSLINRLVNKNISAVSDKANTTSDIITGVLTNYENST
jgi:GTPase Era involved in 16S rRNA processing